MCYWRQFWIAVASKCLTAVDLVSDKRLLLTRCPLSRQATAGAAEPPLALLAPLCRQSAPAEPLLAPLCLQSATEPSLAPWHHSAARAPLGGPPLAPLCCVVVAIVPVVVVLLLCCCCLLLVACSKRQRPDKTRTLISQRVVFDFWQH